MFERKDKEIRRLNAELEAQQKEILRLKAELKDWQMEAVRYKILFERRRGAYMDAMVQNGKLTNELLNLEIMLQEKGIEVKS